jgi:hypothetical protein
VVKKNWKTVVPFALALVMSIAALVGAPAIAKAGKTVASPKRTAKANEVKLKAERPNNSHPLTKNQAPPSKGGAKSKGLVGRLHVDNRTGYYIDIYINGNPEGTVGPFGDLYWSVVDPSPTTSLFGKAPGTSYVWGPREIDPDEDYTWTLNP